MSLASSSVTEIGLLNSSAAFAMSLGAKELFHTNFIAFLLESDDPALAPMQDAIRAALLWGPAPGAVSRCAVWREKNNFDLVLVELRPPPSNGDDDNDINVDAVVERIPGSGDDGTWDWSDPEGWAKTQRHTAVNDTAPAIAVRTLVPTGRVLIVEAKLKSIPRLNQLVEYDSRLASRAMLLSYPEGAVVPAWTLPVGGRTTTAIERRLLSVVGTSMTTPATSTQSPGMWPGIHWKALQVAMQAAIGTLIRHPLGATLSDYVQSLGAVVALTDRTHRMLVDAHVQGSTPTYGAVRRQTLDLNFRSLRINDLLGKTLFDRWLHDHVLPAAAGAIAPAPWRLNSYVNYSNGTPGLGVEIVNDQFPTPSGAIVELRLGVQIQSSELRVFVDVNRGWTGLEAWIAGHSLLLGQWFGGLVFGKQPMGYRQGLTMPPSKAGRATNLKVFDKSRFLYSTVNVDAVSVEAIEQEVGRLLQAACRLAPRL